MGKAQLESLEVIRRDFRKNSCAIHTPTPGNNVQSDEEDL